jgi:NTP pyrophosphatase (non-canonical NTP hydrolase)
MSELTTLYRIEQQKLQRARGKQNFIYDPEKHCSEKEDEIMDAMDILWWKMSDEERVELESIYNPCGGLLNYLAELIAIWSTKKGWETHWLNVPEKLMLTVSEISEAMEEYRHLSRTAMEFWEDHGIGTSSVSQPFEEDIKRLHSFSLEIADSIIRLLNLSASLGIDVEAVIAEKMEKNENRPYKHGGKNC